MKKGIWSEDFRPKTIDGYVFKDEGLKSRVLQWIENGEIPHVTFSGPAGTGKCLGGDTMLSVRVDMDELTDAQRLILEKYMQ